MKKKAAHFLLHPELAHSPPNEAIISALLELGFSVDVFAPGMQDRHLDYGGRVKGSTVEYGKRWLLGNLFSRRWLSYSVFSGTSEDPMAVVGLLARIYRKRSFCLADEIKSGSYRGDAPEYWKKLCRLGMRRAGFNIVNDEARIELQREYAGIGMDKDIIVYPGAFRSPPPPGNREGLHRQWKVPRDAIVLSYSGNFNMTGGADVLLEAAIQDPDVFVLIQPMFLDDITRFLLENSRCHDRLYIEQRRLGWNEAWASMAGVDIGLVMYDNPGPQFQRMGTSSNKLCMYLCMGIPVIALRQDSFRFIEDYGCGVLVEKGEPIVEAIHTIKDQLIDMKANALKCAEEYIEASSKYVMLKDRIRALVD